MIDIMALWKSYEGQKIDQIRWICSENNLADAMTKASPNLVLEEIIPTNKTTIRLKG